MIEKLWFLKPGKTVKMSTAQIQTFLCFGKSLLRLIQKANDKSHREKMAKPAQNRGVSPIKENKKT